MSELYKDKFGRIWKKIGNAVYRKDAGWGGWWDGQGLTPYQMPRRDKAGRFLSSKPNEGTGSLSRATTEEGKH